MKSLIIGLGVSTILAVLGNAILNLLGIHSLFLDFVLGVACGVAGGLTLNNIYKRNN